MIDVTVNVPKPLNVGIDIPSPLDVKFNVAQVGTEKDYNKLKNKPSINDTSLEGNLTGADLGLASINDIYTKEEVNTLLEAKADKTDIPPKTMIWAISHESSGEKLVFFDGTNII